MIANKDLLKSCKLRPRWWTVLQLIQLIRVDTTCKINSRLYCHNDFAAPSHYATIFIHQQAVITLPIVCFQGYRSELPPRGPGPCHGTGPHRVRLGATV